MHVPPAHFADHQINIYVPPLSVNISQNGIDPAGVRTMPGLYLRPSLHPGAGLGVFAAPNGIATRRNDPNPVPAIRRGDIATEYGGEELGAILARERLQSV